MAVEFFFHETTLYSSRLWLPCKVCVLLFPYMPILSDIHKMYMIPIFCSEMAWTLVCFFIGLLHTVPCLHSVRSKDLTMKGQGQELLLLTRTLFPRLWRPLWRLHSVNMSCFPHMCHSKRVGSALDLWGLMVLFHFSLTVFPSMVGLTDRLIRLSGSDQSRFECLHPMLESYWVLFFESVCAFQLVRSYCIWPQPADDPTACLLILLPTERVWSVPGPTPRYVHWMVSTTLYLVPGRVPACTLYTTKLVSGESEVGCISFYYGLIFMYFLLATQSWRA